MRHDEEYVSVHPIIIRGAPFTFRSLHPPDGRFGGGQRGERCLAMDRMVTVTLAAIWVEPTMEVVL